MRSLKILCFHCSLHMLSIFFSEGSKKVVNDFIPFFFIFCISHPSIEVSIFIYFIGQCSFQGICEVVSTCGLWSSIFLFHGMNPSTKYFTFAVCHSYISPSSSCHEVIYQWDLEGPVSGLFVHDVTLLNFIHSDSQDSSD